MMPYLMSVPSLPKRLLRCPFEPVTLTLTLASLLSIWTSYILLSADAKVDTEVSTPQISTPTATVTSRTVVSATFTSTSTPTTIVQASIKVNDSRIREVIQNYSLQKIDSLVDLMQSQFLNPLCSEWNQSLKTWNNSLNGVMETKRSDYNSFQAFKNNISSQFEQESSRINETVNLLSRTALTVGQLNGQELTQNLSLSYWIIDNLFTNLTSSMDEFDTLYRNAHVPAISCPEFSLTPANVTETLDNATTNLLDALHSIERSENFTVSINGKRFISKALAQSGGESQTLLNRCRLLTLITCIVYLVMVLIVSLYEILVFSFEKSIFILHMADILDRCSNKDEAHGEIKLQQNVRLTTQKLILSIREAISYKIANCIYFAGGSSMLTWPRLSFACWWIWSSGRILWILMFYTIVHFQIVSSMAESHQAAATTDKQALLMDKATNPAFQTGSDPLSIYLGTQEACETFETTFEKILATSAEAHLVDLVQSQIDKINSEMTVLGSQFEAVSWANITSIESLTCPTQSKTANGTSLTYVLMSQVVESNVSVSVSVTGATQTNISGISKRTDQTPQSSNFKTIPWHSTSKWTLIALTLAVCIHHPLGFIISN